MRQLLLAAAVGVVFQSGCVSKSTHFVARSAPCRADALNALRDEINSVYGFRDGVPRINLGPCGRFARDFRQRWNARFGDDVHVVFVMADKTPQCHHVLVRLPDGNCYDGGNGVISERTLLTLYPDSHLEDMRRFDRDLLDQRSYGLDRDYPQCPNYSDAVTARIIDRHLDALRATRSG